MAMITRTQMFSADTRTAFQEFAAYAIVTLNCIQDGNWQRSTGRRPHYGLTPGLVGKVVWHNASNRWYAVNAENSHSVQVSDIIWLNDGWQVIGSAKWFSKSQIVVCK